MSFNELGIRDDLNDACTNFGWISPTDIQKTTIPVAMTGADIIGLAETGSGKTGAFLLPIINDWLNCDKPKMFALILTPTRELAAQIEEQFLLLGSEFGLKTILLISGGEMSEQMIELGKWASHVVIATPGRVVSMLAKSKPARTMLETINKLVIDEADRMLHLEFESDMEAIARVLPKRNSQINQKKMSKGKLDFVRQTMMFSATFSAHIEKVAAYFLYRPVKLTADGKLQIPKQLEQSVLVGKHADRMANLFALLRHYLARKITVDKNQSSSSRKRKLDQSESSTEIGTDQSESAESQEIRSAIVFVTTCKQTRPIETFLNRLGASAVALHSQLSQEQRERAIAAFRDGVATVLVATDIASRGLDIDHVRLVVNLDLPLGTDWYKHRVGRTARSGRPGSAVTMVTEVNQAEFVALERRLGLASPSGKMSVHPAVPLGKRDLVRVEVALKETRVAERQQATKLSGLDTDFTRIDTGYSTKRTKLTERSEKSINI